VSHLSTGDLLQFGLLFVIVVAAEVLVLVSLERRLSGAALRYTSLTVGLLMATLLGAPIGGVTGNAVSFAICFVSMLVVGLVFVMRAIRKATP
jgi:predicted MFS family arabinose efflux permease